LLEYRVVVGVDARTRQIGAFGMGLLKTSRAVRIVLDPDARFTLARGDEGVPRGTGGASYGQEVRILVISGTVRKPVRRHIDEVVLTPSKKLNERGLTLSTQRLLVRRVIGCVVRVQVRIELHCAAGRRLVVPGP